MNLNSDTWRDLVFEGKNKEYGAYDLRKTSSKRHIHALIIVIGTVGILTLTFYIWDIFKSYDDDYFHQIVEFKPINLSELSVVEFLAIPKAEDIKPEEKKKNTPPKIVSDEDEIPELVEQTEIASIPADSIELTSSDSIFLANTRAKLSEVEDELVTYVLDPANSNEKALQTTILRHVYHNLKYPDVAYKQRVKGRVVYSFVVNKDGSISDITLVNGVYIFLDEEVLRVINSIPTLEPEKKDGKPIRIKFYLPVVFS
ncbi:MAG: TonB family protein [Dysgonamonadaceae bacterium]|jgi:protein TonB|nr:TonB family protein [Dysgonamonadaceae bacterium]